MKVLHNLLAEEFGNGYGFLEAKILNIFTPIEFCIFSIFIKVV